MINFLFSALRQATCLSSSWCFAGYGLFMWISPAAAWAGRHGQGASSRGDGSEVHAGVLEGAARGVREGRDGLYASGRAQAAGGPIILFFPSCASSVCAHLACAPGSRPLCPSVILAAVFQRGMAWYNECEWFQEVAVHLNKAGLVPEAYAQKVFRACRYYLFLYSARTTRAKPAIL